MLVSLQGSYSWKWGAMPYDQAALYGSSASNSWACDSAIKRSLRSCFNYTWTHWDLTSDYIVSHYGAHCSWPVGEVRVGHYCHQKCVNVCISFTILLGQLRDHLLQCTSAAVVPCEMPPASQPANRDGARSSAVPKRSSHFWNWSASSGSVNLADFSGRVTWEIRVCLFFIWNELKTWFTSQGLWGNFWKKGKLSFWMCLYLFLCMYKVYIHGIFHIYVSYIY